MNTKGHRDLIVWQKAMKLTVQIYQLTKTFPAEERYALTDQLRRAAISIPSNIAEGRRRGSEVEFKHFLRNAFGSAAEIETQLEIAQSLKYGTPLLFEPSCSLLNEIMRMLNKMTSS